MGDYVPMRRGQLEQRLSDFDFAVHAKFGGRRFRLVLVGGAALVLLGCLSRSTVDLDALQAPSELVELMARFNINCRVVAYINNFAYGYEDRLVPLALETKAVEYYTASLEDVVASKLCSPRDLDGFDIRQTEVLEALDWEKLRGVAEDMYESRLNDFRYREFLDSYEAYRREYGPCEH